MLTPRFSCSQTETTVIVLLHTPAIRARDVEVHVETSTLTVHVNPYFLRLVFDAPIVEDDASTARYDPSSGDLTVTVSKQVPGQHFNDLDLLPKLLAPEGSNVPRQPLIEVLEEDEAILQAAENDWQLPQQVPDVPSLNTGIRQPYGFLDLHTGFFAHVAHVPNEINALGHDIESLLKSERRVKLRESEESKWDEEYYMMDFVQGEEIQDIMRWSYPQEDRDFTEAERLAQLRLPRREYLVDDERIKQLHTTLVSILFAFMYDARVTGHDPTSESAWTICALTPCFVALVDHETVSATLVASYRRALAWPLYRSFVLCNKVQADVASLLGRGVKATLQALLEMQHILAGHEAYYVYAKIWVEDYCVWLARHASAESLMALSEEVKEVKVTKSAIGWGLEELEIAAQMAQADIDSDDE